MPSSADHPVRSAGCWAKRGEMRDLANAGLKPIRDRCGVVPAGEFRRKLSRDVVRQHISGPSNFLGGPVRKI
jgi:hypothetical protein